MSVISGIIGALIYGGFAGAASQILVGNVQSPSATTETKIIAGTISLGGMYYGYTHWA